MVQISRKSFGQFARTYVADSHVISDQVSEPLRVVLASGISRTRSHLRGMLMQLGYQLVGESSDGQSAVQLARALTPDAILLDAKLLGMTGAQATQSISRGHYAAVVMAASLVDRALTRQAGTVGAHAWLIKPINERKLHAAIEIAVARFRAARELRRQVSSLREEIESERLVHRAKTVLMVEHRLTEVEAMQRLDKLAAHTGKTLASAAGVIVLAARAADT